VAGGRLIGLHVALSERRWLAAPSPVLFVALCPWAAAIR
jgi:hypothetical protein